MAPRASMAVSPTNRSALISMSVAEMPRCGSREVNVPPRERRKVEPDESAKTRLSPAATQAASPE